MNENLRAVVGLNSFQKAKAYKASKNYGRAFAHYLVVLELMPGQRNEAEAEFTETLCNWGVLLEENEQVEDLCKCFLQALNYFPLSSRILNNFGAHLIRANQNGEAENYLKLAHNLDKDYLLAEKNLLTAKLNLVPRWHFRMLNDYHRNSLYRRAILSYNDKANVKALDIGAGCGILSLFAAENPNIEHIYAVEVAQTMARIAKDVFIAHRSDKVDVINKNSTKLSMADIHGRADLLIMEIFDAALFGEHVLKTVIHAWKNLLKPTAKTIPASADVYVIGVECTDLIKSHRFIGDVSRLHLNRAVCLSQTVSEPYEAESLKNYTVKRVTDTKKIVTVNFTDSDQLKGIYYKEDFLDPFVLNCVEAGRIDVFVVWFDLNLDSSCTISTDPANPIVKCWEQAVVYLDHPLHMQIGDCARVHASFLKNCLKINVLNVPPMCSQCFKASPATLSFLNDTSLTSSLEKLSDSFDTSVRILDLYPFPVLGLILAKKGGQCYCSLQSTEDETFLKYVCDINDIDLGRVFNLKRDVQQLLPFEGSFDVILVDPVSPHGTLSETCLSELELYQKCLKFDGRILPGAVNLYTQIVDSEYLNYVNKVGDENVFGYEIAKFVNEYAVSEEWVIDRKFPHTKLSEPTLISNVLQNDRHPLWTEQHIGITTTGKPTGIVYWFELVYNNDLKICTHDSTFYNCACFLLEDSALVHEGSVLKIKVKQHYGLLKMFCESNGDCEK